MKTFRWIAEWARYVNMHRPITHFSTKENEFPSQPRLVASMTTLPERMEYADAAINSILNQTVAVNEIIFSIPEKSRRTQQTYNIPKRFLDHPKITILRPKTDYGPITKLLPALQREWDQRDTLILCIDDDIVYPSTFVSDLLKAREQLGDVAVTGVGYTIPPLMRDIDRQHFKRKGADIQQAVQVDIVMGAGGFLVQPKMFAEDILNTDDIPKEAFFADDLWISLNLALNNTPCFVAPLTSINPVENLRISNSQNSLGKTANLNGSNNEKMMRRFAEFGLIVDNARN